jgi:hypothetical protein
MMAAEVVMMVAEAKVAEAEAAEAGTEINNTLSSVCLRNRRRSLFSHLVCSPGYRPSVARPTARTTNRASRSRAPAFTFISSNAISTHFESSCVNIFLRASTVRATAGS